MVFGIEVGGRWAEEACDFVRLLARSRARAAPELLRRSTQLAFTLRWTGLLAVAAQRAFAATLLDWPTAHLACVDGEPPLLSEVLTDARLSEPPAASRLPPRTGGF